MQCRLQIRIISDALFCYLSAKQQNKNKQNFQEREIMETISDGVISRGLVVDNERLDVRSGGTVIETTVSGGSGLLYIFDGAVASDTTAKDGGVLWALFQAALQVKQR